MAYSFTLRSVVAKPVKNVWSAHVILHKRELQSDKMALVIEDVLLTAELAHAHLRLRVEFRIAEAVVLLRETDHARRFVHVSRDVPNVEIFCRVHHKELAQPVHEASAALQGLLALVAPIVVHRTPIDLHDWQWACIAPHCDGRCVRVVVDAKADTITQLE